jgi:hypothetical protein
LLIIGLELLTEYLDEGGGGGKRSHVFKVGYQFIHRRLIVEDTFAKVKSRSR